MSKRRWHGPLILAAGIFAAAFLVAGCGGAVKNAIASAAASHGVTFSPPSLPTAGPDSPTSEPTTPEATTAPPTPEVTTAPPPTTEAPSPTPEATTPEPAPTSTPEASGTVAPWVWVLIGLGVLALVGVVIWLARASGRASAASAGWQSRVVDAYAKGSALSDAINVAEAPGALAAPDAAARWADIQRRMDDLAQTFYAMQEAAPDDEQRARVADALGWLQAVRATMTAERGPEGVNYPPERVRSRLASFNAALRALRAPADDRPY
jgi:hypothetical protein